MVTIIAMEKLQHADEHLDLGYVVTITMIAKPQDAKI